MIRFTGDAIDLKKIHESGQSFRWKELAENRFLVVHLNGLCEMAQIDERTVQIEKMVGEPVDWITYLDGHRSYKDANDAILEREPTLKDSIEFGRGIRLLRQDPFEMIMTFIMSANNHIPRIRNFVDKLSVCSGRLIGNVEGEEVYAFPTVEEVTHLTESDFKAMGAGYRAPYFVQTIEYLSASKEWRNWCELDTETLVKELMLLKGVGRKVADCIALFGYGRWEVFPVDTWIKKAAKDKWGIDAGGDKEIRLALERKFPVARGLVQQYMFYYERSIKLERK